jgi:soluble lytic murein transglycosylase-like protein
MQLMPETARDLGIEDPYDPSQNVTAGTRYLKMLIDRYKGNVNVALAAYNWGMGNVERNPGRLPEETRNYIARINGYLEKEEA